jgi:hypothetical protein
MHTAGECSTSSSSTAQWPNSAIVHSLRGDRRATFRVPAETRNGRVSWSAFGTLALTAAVTSACSTLVAARLNNRVGHVQISCLPSLAFDNGDARRTARGD